MAAQCCANSRQLPHNQGRRWLSIIAVRITDCALDAATKIRFPSRRSRNCFDARAFSSTGATLKIPMLKRTQVQPGFSKPAGRPLPSVRCIGAEAWSSLSRCASKGYDYYRACEEAQPPMFQFFALAAYGPSGIVAACPAFRANFRLDVGASGLLRQGTDYIHRRWPGLALSVLGLGSPHADELALGMQPSLDLEARQLALAALLGGLEKAAIERAVWTLFVKDVTERQAAWADPVMRSAGFARLATLPVAHLELPFASAEDYLRSLSPNMRSNLRRKLKKAATVQVDVRTRIDGVEDEILSLRRETQAHVKTNYGDFDELSPLYFRKVLQGLAGSRLLLYRLSGSLIGFSLILLDGDRLTYKYAGFRYPVARHYNLFFLNWMTMVRLCLAHGISHLHAGQTTYLTKVRLGCRLERSWIYFRHRHALINPLFKLFGPMIAIDRTDPDLREIGASAPFIYQTSESRFSRT